jgi:hypothetical protein
MDKRTRHLISERTKEGLRFARARGVKLGNPRPSRYPIELPLLGAASVKWKAEAFADQMFPRIWGYFREGWRLASIADEFNKRRIRTERGGRWHAATIRNILIRKNVPVRKFKRLLELKRLVGYVLGQPTAVPQSVPLSILDAQLDDLSRSTDEEIKRAYRKVLVTNFPPWGDVSAKWLHLFVKIYRIYQEIACDSPLAAFEPAFRENVRSELDNGNETVAELVDALNQLVSMIDDHPTKEQCFPR